MKVTKNCHLGQKSVFLNKLSDMFLNNLSYIHLYRAYLLVLSIFTEIDQKNCHLSQKSVFLIIFEPHTATLNLSVFLSLFNKIDDKLVI